MSLIKAESVSRDRLFMSLIKQSLCLCHVDRLFMSLVKQRVSVLRGPSVHVTNKAESGSVGLRHVDRLFMSLIRQNLGLWVCVTWTCLLYTSPSPRDFG